MHRLVIALAIAVVGARPAIASQETDVMTPVRQFITGFNKKDPKIAQAACADGIFIIDDFPPHAWSGSGAISKWLRDLDAFEKKNGTSDPSVTLGKPRHVDVTGTHAYVIVPTKLSYKKKGQLVKETGLMTLVLHKGAGGWRIAAWSWTDD
jgi:ketosteroid isomerase-like protein